MSDLIWDRDKSKRKMNKKEKYDGASGSEYSEVVRIHKGRLSGIGVYFHGVDT